MKNRNYFAGLAIFASLSLTPALGFANAAIAKPTSIPAPTSDTTSATVAAHAAAKGDALLEALLVELDRSKAHLKIDQALAPYFIEYRVSDVSEYSVEAAFGALRDSQNYHVRVLRVVVRLGDYKQDSYFSRAQGESSILPLDDDDIAIRHQIWLATDDAYKAAVQALSEKQAALKQFSADPNPVDDFAKAVVVTAIEPTVKLTIDEAGWKKTLVDATNLYRQYPDVQSVSANARFDAINDYLVNSEGTITRSGKTTYSLQLASSGQAEDGMRLGRSPAWTVGKLEELPNHDTLVSEAKKMLDTVVALRQAPIVEEEYRGPILFSSDAADDVITSLVGSNVLGRKPQLGKPNRTTGSFATSYKTRVLPNFVTIVDDPTLQEFKGKSLVGNYGVDSEGVKAQAVAVVEDGILTNYLLGRQPLRDFPASNGHGRSAPGSFPQPSLGILVVKSSEPQSVEALKQRVIKMVSDQTLPYAYRVETMGGNVPRLLYRLYAKDGHEELVRGAVFNELDTRALRSDLIAVGDDPLVTNRLNGAPNTVICPSLLFDELEVKRADTSKDKLPDYPAPPLTAK